MSKTYSFWVKPQAKNNGWIFVYSHSNFFYTETQVDDQSIIRIYRHRILGRLFKKFMSKPIYSNSKIANVEIRKDGYTIHPSDVPTNSNKEKD